MYTYIQTPEKNFWLRYCLCSMLASVRSTNNVRRLLTKVVHLSSFI